MDAPAVGETARITLHKEKTSATCTEVRSDGSWIGRVADDPLQFSDQHAVDPGDVEIRFVPHPTVLDAPWCPDWLMEP